MPSTRLLTLKNPLVQCYGAAGRLAHQRRLPGAGVSLQCRSSHSSLDLRAAVHSSTQNSTSAFTVGSNVDIKSLENTLQAHREANRASLVRKIYGKGESVCVEDLDIDLPATEVKVPQQKAAQSIKRLHLSSTRAFRGTSRDLDVLWRISSTEKNPPLQFRLPWLRHLDSPDSSRHVSAIERLAAEIRAFERYSSPSEEEQRAARDALQDFVDSITKIGNGLIVDIIGSRATNLADPLSDLDINVSHPSQWETAGESVEAAPFGVLNKIDKIFRRAVRATGKPVSHRIEVQLYLKKARVPILLCHHNATGLPIQVQSTPRTYDSREYVKAALKEYPSLRGLFKVLKQLLQMRGLTVGSSGGVTSYPLLQMIVAALKFSGGRFHPADVGNQFLFFLDFYSDIDFSKHGLSTEPLELFSKSVGRARTRNEELEGMQDGPRLHGRERPAQAQSTFQRRSRGNSRLSNEYLMTLQDPANPVNDLGKSCFRIQDVQETFIALRATMKRVLAEWDKSSRILGRPEQQVSMRSLLEPCIGGDYRIYEQERDDLRRIGRGSVEMAGEAVDS